MLAGRSVIPDSGCRAEHQQVRVGRAWLYSCPSLTVRIAFSAMHMAHPLGSLRANRDDGWHPAGCLRAWRPGPRLGKGHLEAVRGQLHSGWTDAMWLSRHGPLNLAAFWKAEFGRASPQGHRQSLAPSLPSCHLPPPRLAKDTGVIHIVHAAQPPEEAETGERQEGPRGSKQGSSGTSLCQLQLLFLLTVHVGPAVTTAVTIREAAPFS